MSIAPPVGAMSSYLTRLYAGGPFQELKAAAKGAVGLLPDAFQEGARRAKEMLKGMTVGGTLFEELGFSYIGPIDGHDMEQLLPCCGREGTRDRSGPDPRRDQEGQGLCPRRGCGRQGSRPRPSSTS